ncbi:MAG TPA: aminoacyl-tRNA hydrolase [Terriglobales bacterium]|nr:aminoacyl-tRNA hydrolase [Terriglobales bacterium]
MKLIVGLGNPGIEYQFTPHNMGFLAVDRIAELYGVRVSNRQCRALTGWAVIAEQDVLLAKPETYMNLSGMSVRELVREHAVDAAQDLIVIYDELDLPLGAIRIRQRGSSAGHNGIESIIGALGSDEFVRMRLGTGPDHPVKDGVRYVLGQFKKSQYAAVDQELDTAAEAVKVILSEGVAKAMSRFNRRPVAPEEKGS